MRHVDITFIFTFYRGVMVNFCLLKTTFRESGLSHIYLNSWSDAK